MTHNANASVSRKVVVLSPNATLDWQRWSQRCEFFVEYLEWTNLSLLPTPPNRSWFLIPGRMIRRY
jgi:hypothetical protein